MKLRKILRCIGMGYVNSLEIDLISAQYGSPFSDGTPAASQWPIPPGKYFDYEFMFDDDVSGTL
jgi:Multicopper oxidase